MGDIGEQEGTDREEDGGSRKNGGCVDGAGIDKVVDYRQDDEDAAEAKGCREDNADGLVNAGVIGPCEGEHADW
jgi:hypothetical protein